MRSFKTWFHSVAILLIALAARTWNVARESPGFEEMQASLLALKGPMGWFHSPHIDFCPPVYYLILHPLSWVKAAQMLVLLRVPSVLAGATAALLMYIVGRKLVGSKAALFGAYLLAVNPIHIFYSQEVQPVALFSLMTVVALYYFIRSSESFKARHWIAFDLCAVAMVHLEREALFTIAAFFITHLTKAAFFESDEDQRRLRRLRQFQTVLYNYVLIAAVCLPWLFVMPNRVPWLVNRPTQWDLLHALTRHPLGGVTEGNYLGSSFEAVVLLLLLLPPFIGLLREREFRSMAILMLALLTVLIPFGISFVDKPRFSAPLQAGIAVAFFMLFCGLCIARCNFLVRTSLFLVFFVVLCLASARQSGSLQKTKWNRAASFMTKSSPSDVFVFWPDYTTGMGDYLFGNSRQIVSAGDLFGKWAELPADPTYYFVISQYPDKAGHLYTFRGALEQYSNSTLLWGEGLNSVIRARNLNKLNLQLWYENPRTLSIVDAPTSDTQFCFTPDNEVFQSASHFHSNNVAMSYEPKGRRIVWTSTAKTDLELPVALAAGSYVLKLHCSPQFYDPDTDTTVERTVTVDLRTGDEHKTVTLDSSEIIHLPFSTEKEVRTLPVHIETRPLLTRKEPVSGQFGIKIYSLMIDQVTSPDAR